MSYGKLTKLEICLIIATVSTAFVNINLIIFVGFVLPDHWRKDGYAASSSDDEYIIKECKCSGIMRIRSRESSWTDTIADFPFLVSLTLPAYFDWKEERRYFCSGFIASSKKVITSN